MSTRRDVRGVIGRSEREAHANRRSRRFFALAFLCAISIAPLNARSEQNGEVPGWTLTPAEYSAANAVLAIAPRSVQECDVAIVLNVTASESCHGDSWQYGAAVLRKFRAARAAVPEDTFTIRDYEEAYASNYPADMSQPGLTYAACSVAFADTYTGAPTDAERLSPTNLVCTPSMVAYGTHTITRFARALAAESKVR